MNDSTTTENGLIHSIRLEIFGRIQGIGARPAVARLAHELQLAGCVRNHVSGLVIDLEGSADKLVEFRRRLAQALPALAEIDQIVERPNPGNGKQRFTIEVETGSGPLATPVPQDMAVCQLCHDETLHSASRRSGYPFTSCVVCGPRYTLIESMPFDRERSVMAQFLRCGPCQVEYGSSSDRRYHAQTTCCADCGPRVWLVDAAGQPAGSAAAAVANAAAALQVGQIVAVRGLGGYQLLCDATNESAVRRLRDRKGRPAKPLAVLVGTPLEARQYAYGSDQEAQALSGPANPIVVLRARLETRLAPSIHPGVNTVGLMLPTTPLHALLYEQARRPLVCTSGNREGEPIEFEVGSAQRHLSGIADAWLHHDRPILRPIDDSVIRVIAGRPVSLRLARGLAPLRLDLPRSRPQLAVGGYLKSALAWSNGWQSVLGPHIGDLDTVAARERWHVAREDAQQLYRFIPERLIQDLHPDYYSSRATADGAAAPLGVQHHIAHIAAGMLEHGLLDRSVLGVSWDGTGFGLDATVWGGECFLAEGAARFRRVGHVRPFCLPGGESAIRQPWRVAVALLDQAVDRAEWMRGGSAVWTTDQLEPVVRLIERRSETWAPLTTSAGRLFDGAAALILGITTSQYEGHAAMQLESVADPSVDPSAAPPYPFPWNAEAGQLDWRPLIAAIWRNLDRRTEPDIMSLRFHRALAAGIGAVADQFRPLPVVLSGGVFQNRLLVECVHEIVGDRLCAPGTIPPNDGGLAAGQLAFALWNDCENGDRRE